MKKLFLLPIALMVLSFTINAQSKMDTTKQKAPMSKEEKAKMKAQNEKDLTEAISQLGLNADQEKQVRDVLEDANNKSRELKKNSALSEEAKEAAKKTINDEKNGKLKDILGKDKYKQFTEIRKKQKEKNMNAAGAN